MMMRWRVTCSGYSQNTTMQSNTLGKGGGGPEGGEEEEGRRYRNFLPL